MRYRFLFSFLIFVLLTLSVISCSRKSNAEETDEIYSVTRIDSWLYSIMDVKNKVYCYLLLGEEKALLFDTTYGYGSLHSVISEITELPVIVILGHGHKDHSGGASQMKAYLDSDIWLHEADFEMYEYYYQETRFLNKLEAGMIFNLGDLTVEVIGMGGHTQGSVGILVKEYRTLFTSDSANYHIWLFMKESLSLEQYIAMLERVQKLEFDTFYIGHDYLDSPKSDFQLLINAARNAKAERSEFIEEYNAFHYEENGANVYFNDPLAPDELRVSPLRRNSYLTDRSLPAGNMGSFDLLLRDNFRYGNGYQGLVRDRLLLNNKRLKKGDTFKLKVTYTASRDLESELLVGFADMDRGKWKTLSYTQKDIEPPNVILGPASKAGEEVSSEVIITILTNASSVRPAANTLVFENIGQGRHGRANTGIQGPVTISFSEFILTKQ